MALVVELGAEALPIERVDPLADVGGDVDRGCHRRFPPLHTRGARSGQERTTPLLYTPHDEGFIVVASKAGAERNPAWYHNLRAHPDALAVEIGGRRIPVQSRVVEGAERDELWRIVNDNYNGYETYQGRAPNRVIPVVLLEPA